MKMYKLQLRMRRKRSSLRKLKMMGIPMKKRRRKKRLQYSNLMKMT